MQAQTNVFPVQTHVVGQTQVVPVQTIATSQERNAASGVEVIEIIFRVLCTVSRLFVTRNYNTFHQA